MPQEEQIVDIIYNNTGVRASTIATELALEEKIVWKSITENDGDAHKNIRFSRKMLETTTILLPVFDVSIQILWESFFLGSRFDGKRNNEPRNL